MWEKSHQCGIGGGSFNTSDFSTPNNNINHFDCNGIYTDKHAERCADCCSRGIWDVDGQPRISCVNKPFLFNRVGWVSGCILQLGTHGRWCGQTAQETPCTQAGQCRGQHFYILWHKPMFQLANSRLNSANGAQGDYVHGNQNKWTPFPDKLKASSKHLPNRPLLKNLESNHVTWFEVHLR